MNEPRMDGVREAILQGSEEARKREWWFDSFCQWIRDELRDRDVENRIKGCENKTTEAQALAVILDVLGYPADERQRVRE